MRSSRNIKYVFALLFYCIYSLANAQTWPFKNNNGEVIIGKITGTVGDFRRMPSSSDSRFHAGVDFVSPYDRQVYPQESRVVYSIHSGTISINFENNAWRDYIRITLDDGTDVYYKHIRTSSTNPVTGENNLTELRDGDEVEVGDFLGLMALENGGPSQHVHINDNSAGNSLTGTTNFLNNFLSPFSDSHSPDYMYGFDVNGGEVLSSDSENSFEFRQNGHTYTNTTTLIDSDVEIGGLTHKVAYGNLDIVSRIRDRHILEDGTGSDSGDNGINAISYEILNKSGQRINPTGETTNIVFDEVPDNANANFVFDSRSNIGNGLITRHVYILTGNPLNEPYDRFWGSRINLNEDEDWETQNRIIDASINALAKWKDDQYVIRVTARDIANSSNDQWNTTSRDTKILVDNFKPYIKKIEIKVAPADPFYARVYEAEWTWDDQEKWLNFNETGGAEVSPTDYLEFIIYSSEPLTTEGNMTPTIQLEGAITQPTFFPALSDEEKYVFRLAPGNYDEEGNDSGPKTITINAYDLAGNQITGFDHDEFQITEDDLPIHLADGNWSGRLSKLDTKFKLNIQGSICSPPGGRTASGECATIIADFYHTPDNVNSKTIYFTDASNPSNNIISWNWDFGDGNVSSNQNPTHTYQFTGDYPVTLTVSNGTESDSRTEFITVTNDILIAEFTASSTSGEAPLLVDFNSSGSQGNIQSWFWEVTPSTGVQYVSGNDQSQHPSILFEETGQFEVRLTVDNGLNSHTSAPEIVNVSEGNSGNTNVDFYWDGNVYSGGAMQFYDDSFVKCIGSNTQYSWTIHETFPQTYIGRFPIISFTEIGSIDVQLCVTDNCETTCETKTITVEDASEANSDLHPLFSVIGGSEHEIGEPIEFVDNSYSSNGANINFWTWWYELPLDFPLNQQHSGPNDHYLTDRYSVNHTYHDPGKFLVRLWLHEDLGFQGKNYDKIIIIRRPSSFCQESSGINDRIYEFGSEEMEIAGEFLVGNTGDVIAENGSTVDFVSTRTKITKGHFHPGSKVHIKGEDCDTVRSTFEE